MTVKINTSLMNATLSNGIISSSVYAWRTTTSAGIRIYKGTIPTKNDLSTSSTYARDYRASDILIEWTGLNMSTVTNNRFWSIDHTSLVKTAEGSGVASWFYFGSVSAVALSASPVAVGTITGPGGGGDVIVDNVNIVSGQTYYLKQWLVEFPNFEWTF